MENTSTTRQLFGYLNLIYKINIPEIEIENMYKRLDQYPELQTGQFGLASFVKKDNYIIYCTQHDKNLVYIISLDKNLIKDSEKGEIASVTKDNLIDIKYKIANYNISQDSWLDFFINKDYGYIITTNSYDRYFYPFENYIVDTIDSKSLSILEEYFAMPDEIISYISNICLNKNFASLKEFIATVRNIVFSDINNFNTKLSNEIRDLDNFDHTAKFLFDDPKITSSKSNTSNVVGAEIEKVVEKNNIRFAYINNTESHRGNLSILFDLNFPFYNYIDAERKLLTDKYSNKIICMFADLKFSFNKFYSSKYSNETNELENFKRLKSGQQISIIQTYEFEQFLKNEKHRKNIETVRQQEIDLLDKKFRTKLDILKTPSGSFKLNDMVFKQDSIDYKGKVLNSNIEDWVYWVVYNVFRQNSINNVIFDNIYEMFVYKTCSSLFSLTDSANLKVDNINIFCTKKISTTKTGVRTTRFFINDIKLNREDLSECIKRSLCFTEQKYYDEFLTSVSKCSLKTSAYLNTGLSIKCRDTFLNKSINLHFPLIRRNSRNYIIINNKKYSLHDTAAAIKLTELSSFTDIINKLLSNKIIDGLDIQETYDLIESGSKNYEEVKNKENKILEETEKLFNLVTLDNVRLDNNLELKKAYLIKGKIAEYVIDAENDHKVFLNPSGKYICMIDKSNTNYGKDKLISRIYALHNDEFVSNEITTIQELQNENS